MSQETVSGDTNKTLFGSKPETKGGTATLAPGEDGNPNPKGKDVSIVIEKGGQEKPPPVTPDESLDLAVFGGRPTEERKPGYAYREIPQADDPLSEGKFSNMPWSNLPPLNDSVDQDYLDRRQSVYDSIAQVQAAPDQTEVSKSAETGDGAPSTDSRSPAVLDDILHAPTDFVHGIAKGIHELNEFTGFTSKIEDFAKFIHDHSEAAAALDEMFGKYQVNLPRYPEANTGIGRFAEGAGQFFAGAAPISRAIEGLHIASKIPSLAKALTINSATLASAFDPKEPGIGNLLSGLANDHPEIRRAADAFLAVDPKDADGVNRTKKALFDSIVLTGAGHVVATGAVKLFDAAKSAGMFNKLAKPLQNESGMVNLAGSGGGKAPKPAADGRPEQMQLPMEIPINPVDKYKKTFASVPWFQKKFGINKEDMASVEAFMGKSVETPPNAYVPDIAERLGANYGKVKSDLPEVDTGAVKRSLAEARSVNAELFEKKLPVRYLEDVVREAEARWTPDNIENELRNFLSKDPKQGLTDVELVISGAISNAIASQLAVLKAAAKAGTPGAREALVQMWEAGSVIFFQRQRFTKAASNTLNAGKASIQGTEEYTTALRNGLIRYVDENAALPQAGDPLSIGKAASRPPTTQRELPFGSKPITADRPPVEALSSKDDADRIIRIMNNVEKEAREIIHADPEARASLMAMAAEYWQNLVLGLTTHVNNFVAGSMLTLWQIPVRLTAAGFSKIFNSENGVHAMEAAAMMHGQLAAITDALRLLAKNLKHVAKLEPVETSGITKFGTPQNAITGKNFGLAHEGILARGVDLLGEFVRTNGKLVVTVDELIKVPAKRGKLYALAIRSVMEDGLEGEAAAMRYQQIITNPPKRLILQTEELGDYIALTKELGQAGKYAEGIINEWPILKLFGFGFFRAGVNSIKIAGEHTPLGLASHAIRADIKAGGVRRDIALARIALGSMLLLKAGSWALDGRITGGGVALDEDIQKAEGQRNQQAPSMKGIEREAGFRPYSFVETDEKGKKTYTSFKGLEMLAPYLSMAANYVQILRSTDEQTASQMYGAVVLAITKPLLERQWTSHFLEIVDAFEEGRINEIIKRVGASFVPAIESKLEKGIDPEMRDTKYRGFAGDPLVKQVNEMLNKIKAKIPGHSSTLPPRRGLFGEVLTEDPATGAFWPEIASTYFRSRDDKNPHHALYKELLAQKAIIMPVDDTIHGVNLTDREYTEYQIQSGIQFKRLLTELLRNPGYIGGTDGPEGLKAVMIRKAAHISRKIGAAIVIEKFPRLITRMENDKIERINQMIRPGLDEAAK